MEKFLIVTNEARDPGFEITDRMMDYIHKKGASCWSANKMMADGTPFDMAKAAELVVDGGQEAGSQEHTISWHKQRPPGISHRRR